MSSLVLNTLPITDILEHPGADRLEIAQFQGWNCIVVKGQFHPGDVATYFPPDLLIPKELGDALNVTKYLKGLGSRYPERERFAGRVGVARLRGVPSYGILVHPDADWLAHMDDLAGYLGVEKYEPPEEILDGDSQRRNPFFHPYTEIENLRNFPDAFTEGEPVIVTEKIHGRNCRIGLCYEDEAMVVMAGSHNVRRKQYTTKGTVSAYWKPLEMYPQIEEMLREIYLRYQHNVILFGELYGPGMQDLTYGQKDLAFRLFDIAYNINYVDDVVLQDWADHYEIPTVPPLYKGPFLWKTMEECATGSSVIPATATPHMREGIVIRPLTEARDLNGRKIYKLINFDYLNRKGGTEQH